MSRKSILEVTKDVLKVLSDKKEHSIKSVSYQVRSHWFTTMKSLEFLKEINLVKERKGEKTYKEERLFKLK